MRPPVVMDTNVAIVANLRTPQAGDRCVEACIAALLDIRDRRRILLDEDGQILEEYRRYLSPSGQPGAGDAFFKWLWSNQANPEHCRQVQGGEFPDDPALAGFDRSDRKFVVVVIASGERPPVLNATDSDWWEHRETLSRHGVEIHFICSELMGRQSRKRRFQVSRKP